MRIVAGVTAIVVGFILIVNVLELVVTIGIGLVVGGAILSILKEKDEY